ncbi:general secretion pathway protein GspB [Pseudogulbenkiania sp. MAI-1]|uniref:general secretion pathway protein GspB n=1 Tax=Pseudogulbenkiania sp. MAI-1 TaxID=990370 RepID=UPI00045E8EF4|nr:general secretion pathway protein GspB [Pseudogulbenkiania sp. MAI-1]
MSYILDALLKADQERQRNATPTLNSVHAPYVAEPSGPRRRWLYPVLLTLLGGGLLVSGLLLGIRPAASAPERSAQAQAATPSPAAPAKHLEKVTASPQVEPPRLNAPLSAAVAPLHTPTPPATAQTAPPPATVATMTRDKTPSHERRMASPAAPTAPAPSAETDAVASVPLPAEATPAVTLKRSNRILDLGELPPELRKEVEENVIVSGSSFSADNNERMAIINDRARRAGDEVATGMKLETILPDGIVLNYKGYRFRTGMY